MSPLTPVRVRGIAPSAALLVAWCGLASPASAADAGPVTPPLSGAIAIEADQGIEWHRRSRQVIARGSAKAVRGDLRVSADVLTASYRERPDGSAEVWRIDGEGNVRLASPGESAYAEKGVFDLDANRLTLSGGKEVGVTTTNSRITATREIEYDTQTQMLIARGDAVAVDGDRTLSGDVITVQLRKDDAGGTQVRRLEAQRNVRLLAGGDDIRADRGTYDVDSGLATMDGSVKIIRGQNVLTGCRGEANVKTGVSRLFACRDPRSGGTRVQGVILPDAAKKP